LHSRERRGGDLLPACRRGAIPSDVQLAGDASSPVPPYWIDCVGVIHVVQWRGIELANATRFGESNPSLRTVARISDLGASDLRAFCDWEACVRVNGYGHTCWVNDAGFEQCRMCDGSADCDGHAMSEDDCVAHASDPGRATCHVGLLQECTLQQSLRAGNTSSKKHAFRPTH